MMGKDVAKAEKGAPRKVTISLDHLEKSNMIVV